jgi:hypothetical protein
MLWFVHVKVRVGGLFTRVDPAKSVARMSCNPVEKDVGEEVIDVMAKSSRLRQPTPARILPQSRFPTKNSLATGLSA